MNLLLFFYSILVTFFFRDGPKNSSSLETVVAKNKLLGGSITSVNNNNNNINIDINNNNSN